MKKKLLSTVVLCIFLLCSCGKNNSGTSGENADSPDIPDDIFSYFDIDTTEGPAPVNIKLDGETASVSGDGASFEDGILYVKSAGTYVLSGSFSGSVRVEASKEEDVHLILNGVDIQSEGAAIYGASSDKIVITIADNTTNSLSDGTDYYKAKGDKPNACIYSDDDLTINGNGSLTVNGNCNNGIGTKNDLRIVSGTVIVTAQKNALKGNDSVVIGDGRITLTSGKDAIKSDNEKEEGRGKVSIFGGKLELNAGDDGIQAVSEINIPAGSLKITANDSPVYCDGKINIADGVLAGDK